MQTAYINALYELMGKDARVCSLLSDSGTEYDEMLMREFPNQCYNFGIAEQGKVAAAAGMASCGKIPFVYTSGAFLAYRAYEFIRDDVCFQRKNVKIIGMGSGLSWSTLGPSHHTTEDFSVLRSLPHMTVFSPASPYEVRQCVNAAYQLDGPVYVRLGMSREKEIYESPDYAFVPGKNIQIAQGKDAAVLCTGSIIEEVLKASEYLLPEGISARIINVHTIKPFDQGHIREIAGDFKHLFTVEEHNVTGGLGTAVCEALAGLGAAVKLTRIGLDDCFAQGYGTHAQVLEKNGLDGKSIADKIMRAMR